MIPPQKLEKLPRHQRLRKIGKIFAEAEKRAAAAVEPDCVFSAEDWGFFADMACLLQKDPAFSAAAQPALEEAALVLRQAALTQAALTQAALTQAALTRAAHIRAAHIRADEPAPVRRALNTVRHILLTETGRSPADWDFIDSGGRLDPAKRRPFPGMLVYLEDIRSPFNVGAMFRSAESFGAEKLLLSPLCADPGHPRAMRSAMGCVDVLPWEKRDLAADRFSPDLPLFALETGGTPLDAFAFPRRGILIAGSEELGVSPPALAAADASLGRVSIPCYGAKGSLNVSVAFGIVMHAWARRLAAANG
jgi:TrmH family RNA methyltransferase